MKDSDSCTFPTCDGSVDFSFSFPKVTSKIWDVAWSSSVSGLQTASFYGYYGHNDSSWATITTEVVDLIAHQRPALEDSFDIVIRITMPYNL